MSCSLGRVDPHPVDRSVPSSAQISENILWMFASVNFNEGSNPTHQDTIVSAVSFGKWCATSLLLNKNFQFALTKQQYQPNNFHTSFCAIDPHYPLSRSGAACQPLATKERVSTYSCPISVTLSQVNHNKPLDSSAYHPIQKRNNLYSGDTFVAHPKPSTRGNAKLADESSVDHQCILEVDNG
ncbi:hypothetical protein RF11_02419 [Thelohanellus kitauei]|uniref:Uncharacterized protein n=1 Tax=Thelohanellus kitauei TaxID=669202 RepID=A0A0C2MRA4_THEKT|nr:hypothetical protein RF11_02419 [Thelohanellus kitauei]